MQGKLSLGSLLLLAIAVAACSNPSPYSAPSRLHFKSGQSFSAAFSQVTTGSSDLQPLGSTFSATEHFSVSSVDPKGVATITVTLSDFAAQTAGSEPITAPGPFQFTIDSQGRILQGHAWPLLGAIQTLPAPDQLCVPLPASPLAPGMTWSAPAGHALKNTMAASSDSVQAGFPATLDATLHSTFSISSTQDGITSSSTGSVDQSLSCQFDVAHSHPLGLHSTINFSSQQSATLNGNSQSGTASGNIVTTLDYAF